MLSWPSQSAMTAISTPDCNRCMAVLCLTTCGVMVLVERLGQRAIARWTARWRRYLAPYRESGLPRVLGKAIGMPNASNSWNQLFKTRAVSGQSGTVRSFRPLPCRWRKVVAPKWTCGRVSVIISDTRAPLLYSVSKRAWSRRPIQWERSGAARRASISSRVRYPMSFLSSRLRGMASTRVAIATLSGARKATNRKNVRRAERRMLRERTRLPRCCSRESRKARIVGASRSVTRRADGSIPRVCFMKFSKSRKVSRQLAIVWGLRRLCCWRCSTKKAWTDGAMREGAVVMASILLWRNAGTGLRRRSGSRASRSDTSNFPGGGHGLDTRRDAAAELVHRRLAGARAGSARWQRRVARHGGLATAQRRWARGRAADTASETSVAASKASGAARVGRGRGCPRGLGSGIAPDGGYSRGGVAPWSDGAAPDGTYGIWFP